MIAILLLLLLFLVDVHPTTIIPKGDQHNLPLLTQMIPHHVINQQILPYLTNEDIQNFQMSLFDEVLAVLKIKNPEKRSKLLKKYLKYHDASNQQNYLLRFAAAKGMIDIVKILLKYPGVDPTAKNNWAFILARENKHDHILNLLSNSDRDLEIGAQVDGSSQSLLMEILDSGAQTSTDEAQDVIDLKLLLKTSTKLLPHLKQGIINAIYTNRNDLAKIMLYFVSFDHLYFNHLVYFRQLAAGNSIRDIRKVDPFEGGLDSLISAALRSNNLEIIKLILDKSLKWNPFTILCFGYYCRRIGILQLTNRWFFPTDEEGFDLLNRLNLILYRELCLPRCGCLIFIFGPLVIGTYFSAIKI